MDLRQTHTGGFIVTTAGVHDRGAEFVKAAIQAIVALRRKFDTSNDPLRGTRLRLDRGRERAPFLEDRLL